MCLHRQLMLLLLLCQYSIDAKGILFNSDIKLDLKTRQYNNMVVIVSNNHEQHKCKEMLEDLQVIFYTIFSNIALKIEMRKDIKDSSCGLAAFKWVVILAYNFRTLLRKVLCEIRTHVELNFGRAVG